MQNDNRKKKFTKCLHVEYGWKGLGASLGLASQKQCKSCCYVPGVAKVWLGGGTLGSFTHTMWLFWIGPTSTQPGPAATQNDYPLRCVPVSVCLVCSRRRWASSRAGVAGSPLLSQAWREDQGTAGLLGFTSSLPTLKLPGASSLCHPAFSHCT